MLANSLAMPPPGVSRGASVARGPVRRVPGRQRGLAAGPLRVLRAAARRREGVEETTRFGACGE